MKLDTFLKLMQRPEEIILRSAVNQWQAVSGDMGYYIDSAICFLTDTKGVILCNKSCHVFTVGAGGNLTISGATAIYSVTNMTDIFAARISDSQAIVCDEHWEAAVPSGRARVLTLDGSNNPSTNVAAVFEAGGMAYPSVTLLSATKALVCYSRLGLKCAVLTINDTLVTATASVTIYDAATTTYVTCAALSSTKVICAYVDRGVDNSYKTKVVIINVSGTTATAATPVEVEGKYAHLKIQKITETTALLSFGRNESPFDLLSVVLSVDRNDITVNDIATETTGYIQTYLSTTMVSPTTCLLVTQYSPVSGTVHLAFNTAEVSGTTVHINPPEIVLNSHAGQRCYVDSKGGNAVFTYSILSGGEYPIRAVPLYFV